jgi:hypothetical protein
VGVEVADVEAPQDGPLDLGPAFPPDLVEIGVVPDVGHRPGKAAVTVEKRRGLGDRTPPVEVVLGVHGELDAHVLAPVAGRRPPGPGTGHHEAGARGQPVAQGLVDTDVGGVAEAEIVAVEDQELGVGAVSEAFSERRHALTVVVQAASACRSSTGRTAVARAARARATPRRPARRVFSSRRQLWSPALGRAAAVPRLGSVVPGRRGWYWF